MQETEKPVIICLTPIRNEAWILERFLQCASLWADHIIIGDQNSDDGSREIVGRFPKARLIQNLSQGYDEGERQRVVFEEARNIPGNKILLAIDADELVSANYMRSQEWKRMLQASPGTIIRFQWVNILPDRKHCWIPEDNIPMGFVDDGIQAHSSGKFHIPRLPTPAGAPEIVMKEVKVLHYQYTNWERMKSKQRHYQCSERVKNPKKHPIQLYRQYHHMYEIQNQDVIELQPEWTEGYEQLGIDTLSVNSREIYPWDTEILEMMLKYNKNYFRKIDIWDVDWAAMADKVGVQAESEKLTDPRSSLEKRVFRWLEATQKQKMDRKVRLLQRALRLLGW